MTEREIVDAIAAARKSQKITQSVMAKKIGVNARSFSGFECGRTRMKISRILQMCEVLGLSLTVQKIAPSEERRVWQECFLEMTKDFPPEDVEMLFEIARVMRDRRNLRP